MPLPEKFYVQITNPVSGLRWFTAFGSSSFSISSWVAEGLVIRESAYGPQNPSLENCRDARLLRRSDFIASGDVSSMFKAEQDIADKWEDQAVRFLRPGCP